MYVLSKVSLAGILPLGELLHPVEVLEWPRLLHPFADEPGHPPPLLKPLPREVVPPPLQRIAKPDFPQLLLYLPSVKHTGCRLPPDSLIPPVLLDLPVLRTLLLFVQRNRIVIHSYRPTILAQYCASLSSY